MAIGIKKNILIFTHIFDAENHVRIINKRPSNIKIYYIRV